ADLRQQLDGLGEPVEEAGIGQVLDLLGAPRVRQVAERWRRPVRHRLHQVAPSAGARLHLPLEVVEPPVPYDPALVGGQRREAWIEEPVAAYGRGRGQQRHGGAGDDRALAEAGEYRVEQV